MSPAAAAAEVAFTDHVTASAAVLEASLEAHVEGLGARVDVFDWSVADGEDPFRGRWRPIGTATAHGVGPTVAAATASPTHAPGDLVLDLARTELAAADAPADFVVDVSVDVLDLPTDPAAPLVWNRGSVWADTRRSANPFARFTWWLGPDVTEPASPEQAWPIRGFPATVPLHISVSAPGEYDLRVFASALSPSGSAYTSGGILKERTIHVVVPPRTGDPVLAGHQILVASGDAGGNVRVHDQAGNLLWSATEPGAIATVDFDEGASRLLVAVRGAGAVLYERQGVPPADPDFRVPSAGSPPSSCRRRRRRRSDQDATREVTVQPRIFSRAEGIDRRIRS